MKILMIGLGSIGQRHLRNIRRLYGDEHEILAYRVRRLQKTFSDDMKIRDGVNLEEEFNIRAYSHLDEALLERPQVAYITNITAKHIDCAIRAAKAGCDLFLEKPVSDSMNRISELQEAIAQNHNIVYIGYQNRFHPCIQDVKGFLESGFIGRTISVDNEFSERLVTMHTYEDYSKTYMAKNGMGGGVRSLTFKYIALTTCRCCLAYRNQSVLSQGATVTWISTLKIMHLHYTASSRSAGANCRSTPIRIFCNIHRSTA